MPLCPTCVVEHTEEHYECGQKPTYPNLNDSLHESKQKCYAHCAAGGDGSQERTSGSIQSELLNYVQGLPEYINQRLYTP